MSVSKVGGSWYYRFQIKGQKYNGTCTGCTTKAQAEKFSDQKKKLAEVEREDLSKKDQEIRANKSVVALVENYRRELTGVDPIRLTEAYALAAGKPSKRQAIAKVEATRHRYYDDFMAFMTKEFPEADTLDRVRRAHCEAYVKYLVDHGRYSKDVVYQSNGKAVGYTRDYKVAPKTIKEIAGACKWVFSRLMEDAGLLFNPWENVVLPAADSVDREVFSPNELRLIWDGIQKDDFCRPLFMIAANSGLTEGDICCMKWADIDWASGCLKTRRRKTGVRITLPLLPELIDYLQSLPREGEYVLPEHAAMYLRQSSCVSSRVKNFLNGLGIVTTVEVPGRRDVSVKDLHSMRHVFCYRAKRAGIPESIIMKFVGHAVLAMTQHYANHDTDAELREEIQKLQPLFIGEAGVSDADTESRKTLATLAMTLPIETVRRLLGSLQRELPNQQSVPLIG